MTINFLEIAGEFCTKRDNSGIPIIIEKIETALTKNENIVCNWEGVKILTPSFIDEIMPKLIIKYGREKIDRSLSFSPPLEGFLAHQIERGIINRTN